MLKDQSITVSVTDENHPPITVPRSTASVAAVLKQIADENDGILMPEHVVEAARPSHHPLHDRFEWDDTEAAHQYRIDQARRIIRVTVTMLPAMKGQRVVRSYTSLTPDREKGGGYRETVVVLSNPDMRKQMLADAMDELRVFRRKYSILTELAGVFGEFAKLEEDNGK